MGSFLIHGKLGRVDHCPNDSAILLALVQANHVNRRAARYLGLILGTALQTSEAGRVLRAFGGGAIVLI